MFRSADDAIRFAFRMRAKPIIAMPSNVYLSKEERQSSTKGGELSAYDLHAQAGMIWGYMERLNSPELAWVYVTYGDKREQHIASRILAQHATKSGDVRNLGRSSADVRRAIESRSIRHCAKLLRTTSYKAMVIRRAVGAVLEQLAMRVYDDLEKRMGLREESA